MINYHSIIRRNGFLNKILKNPIVEVKFPIPEQAHYIILFCFVHYSSLIM